MAILSSIEASALPVRASASMAASLRSTRSGAASGDSRLMLPSTKLRRPPIIFSCTAGGNAKPAALLTAST
jgi:hypothetical protein